MANCTLTGYILDAQGTPLENVTIAAVPSEVPAIISGTSNALSVRRVEVYTTSTGYFELPLLQNAYFHIVIKEIGYEDTVKIPVETTVVLWTLTSISTTGKTDEVNPNW